MLVAVWEYPAPAFAYAVAVFVFTSNVVGVKAFAPAVTPFTRCALAVVAGYAAVGAVRVALCALRATDAPTSRWSVAAELECLHPAHAGWMTFS